MGEESRRGRPQGRRRLFIQRAQYFELMKEGMSNRSAGAIVGINVRTGQDWRKGLTRRKVAGVLVRIPDSTALPSERHYRQISPRFLSDSERIEIADLHRAGVGIRPVCQAVEPLTQHHKSGDPVQSASEQPAISSPCGSTASPVAQMPT
jgi:IS30 family transposase